MSAWPVPSGVSGMIVNSVVPVGSRHCETSTLGVLLRHEGIDLSESMIFGLGSGLGFVYWDAKAMDFPFVGGRSRPAAITRNVAERLGLTLRVNETTSARKAWQQVATEIDAGHPVGLQLDCYHLEYFTQKIHFGGHFVAMYGYDDDRAYLVDTEQQGGAVTTGLPSLALARAEKGPMTARNLSYTITRGRDLPELADAALAAVRANAEEFLNPPIANLGHRGIARTADRVTGWFQRSSDPRRDFTVTADLMERGGTGGALFRNLYAEFLAECAVLTGDEHIARAQGMYARIAPLWSEVAEQIAAAGETGETAHLDRASVLLRELARQEHEAMCTLAGAGRA